jgi:hypothetical protein
MKYIVINHDSGNAYGPFTSYEDCSNWIIKDRKYWGDMYYDTDYEIYMLLEPDEALHEVHSI